MVNFLNNRTIEYTISIFLSLKHFKIFTEVQLLRNQLHASIYNHKKQFSFHKCFFNSNTSIGAIMFYFVPNLKHISGSNNKFYFF